MRKYKSSQELRKIRTTGSQAAWISSKRNTLAFVSILGKSSSKIVLFGWMGPFLYFFFTHTPWCMFIISQDVCRLGAALYISCWRSPTTAAREFPKVFSLWVADHTFSKWLIAVLSCPLPGDTVRPHWCHVSVPLCLTVATVLAFHVCLLSTWSLYSVLSLGDNPV